MWSKHDVLINVRENRRGNQEWTIQRNWQHWVHKTHDEDKQQINNTICVGHHHTKTKSNKINIMKRKFMMWWSTITPISTRQHVSLSEKTITYLDYWKANPFLYCIKNILLALSIFVLQNHNLFTFEDVSSHTLFSFDAAPLSRNQTSWPFVGFTLAAGKGVSSFPSSTL